MKGSTPVRMAFTLGAAALLGMGMSDLPLSVRRLAYSDDHRRGKHPSAACQAKRARKGR
jgi:hypothetical protein